MSTAPASDLNPAWLLFWPRGLTSLRDSTGSKPLRAEGPIYLVGMRVGPTAICVTGGVSIEYEALWHRLNRYNEANWALGDRTKIQVLGQLHLSCTLGGEDALKYPTKAKLGPSEAGVWIAAVYCKVAGEENLKLCFNPPGGSTATVIYYRKPTGAAGPFYAMMPFSVPPQPTPPLLLRSHCTRRDGLGEDPVLSSLALQLCPGSVSRGW